MSTLTKYRSDLERHILPKLGHLHVDEIEPWQVAELLVSGGAAQSRRNRRTVLSLLASYAVIQGHCRLSWIPPVRIKGGRRYTEENPNLLEQDQIGGLLNKIPDYWSTVVWTLAMTGLRWGEVSGLKWTDIDFHNRVLRVRRTNWKGQLLERPKNEAAIRVVPLPIPLVAKLEAHRAWMRATKHPGMKAGLVFPTGAGEPHAGWPLLRVLCKACKHLGFPRLTTHGLRRTYNNLLRQVADGITVRAIVGHSDEKMTEHYSRVSIPERHEAAGKVLALIEGSVRPECASEEGEIS